MALISLFLTCVGLWALQDKHWGWICVLPFGAIVLSHFLTPTLLCPSCKNNLEGGGPFCPECGAYGLKPAGHAMEHCSACNRDIDYHGKGRRYIIRACTHCGLRLDGKGV
jgi:predicted amidophosphoribosyltransferase